MHVAQRESWLASQLAGAQATTAIWFPHWHPLSTCTHSKCKAVRCPTAGQCPHPAERRTQPAARARQPLLARSSLAAPTCAEVRSEAQPCANVHLQCTLLLEARLPAGATQLPALLNVARKASVSSTRWRRLVLQDRQAWHQQEQPALQAACSGSLALWAVCSPRDSSGLTRCQAMRCARGASLSAAGSAAHAAAWTTGCCPSAACVCTSQLRLHRHTGWAWTCLPGLLETVQAYQIAAARLRESCWCSASINKRQRAVTHLFKTGVCQLKQKHRLQRHVHPCCMCASVMTKLSKSAASLHQVTDLHCHLQWAALHSGQPSNTHALLAAAIQLCDNGHQCKLWLGLVPQPEPGSFDEETGAGAAA